MHKIRLVLSIITLLGTITLGLVSIASAVPAPQACRECDCINGFTRRAGVAHYDTSGHLTCSGCCYYTVRPTVKSRLLTVYENVSDSF